MSHELYTPTHCQDKKPVVLRWTRRRLLGADALAGDPLAHLQLTNNTYAYIIYSLYEVRIINALSI